MPSSVAFIDAPNLFNSTLTASILLDSLTFNSSAPLITVSPFA